MVASTAAEGRKERGRSIGVTINAYNVDVHPNAGAAYDASGASPRAAIIVSLALSHTSPLGSWL